MAYDNNKDKGGENVLPPTTNQDDENSSVEIKEEEEEEPPDDGGLMRELLEEKIDAQDKQRIRDMRTLLEFDFNLLKWFRQKPMLKRFSSVLPNFVEDYCEWLTKTDPYVYFDRIPDEHIARLYAKLPMDWRVVTVEKLTDWGRDHAIEYNMRNRRRAEEMKRKQPRQRNS